MTREEAIQNREDCLKYLEGIGRKASPECVEAVRWSVKALKALRPVSREQVEKVWRGEWNYSHTTETDHFAVVKCSKCGHEAFAIALYVKDENFCPHCGAPMTDEAVEMVMERMGALNDAD